MSIVLVLVVIAIFLSFVVIEKQNVEIKNGLKRIEDKLDAKKEGKK